jgi:hypothetical protein
MRKEKPKASPIASAMTTIVVTMLPPMIAKFCPVVARPRW